MHHLRSFQKENSNFLSRVMVLFNSGKTGGGFWSQGRSLLAADVAPLGAADIPHFICNARNAGGGGKKKRSKPRNDKPRRQAGPSKSMGRQTKIARKPGGRVTRVGAFPDAEGGAQKLSDDPNKSSFRLVVHRFLLVLFIIDTDSTIRRRRKKAGAKSAVAARADAAQKRMDDAKKLARRGAKLNNKGKQVGAQVISSDEDEEIDQLASDSEDEEEEGSEEDELRQIEDDEGEYLKRELAKYLSHAGAGEVAEGYESDSDIEIIELPIKNAVKKQPIGNAIASGSGSNSKKWTCSACTLQVSRHSVYWKSSHSRSHNNSQNSMSSSRCDVCDANRP
jgi:hypothetical protein